MDPVTAPPRPLGLADLPHALISQVLGLLSPLQLARASAVCRLWRQLVGERAGDWRAFFAELWPASVAVPPNDASGAAWQLAYGRRQLQAASWLGRPAVDKLVGAQDATKACALLPAAGLLFAGGMDRIVRVYDLGSGMQLAATRRHGGTVRCLAADEHLLASGSSDHAIRVWRAGGGGGVQQAWQNQRGQRQQAGPVFDLAGERAVLTGHTGPVSALQLSPGVLVSGSWDCSIRVWDRASLQCRQLVQTDDWVSSLSLRGGVLAAACGRELLLFRLEDGLLHRLGSLSCPSLSDRGGGGGGASAGDGAGPAALTAVQVAADGRAAFAGAADGGVWALGVPGCGGAPPPQRPALLQRRPAEVAGLSWEHPWLAVADRAGSVALLECGTATAAGAAAVEGRHRSGGGGRRASRRAAAPRPSRVLHAGGAGGAGWAAGAQCVALAGQWAAAGLDCGSVLTWDSGRGLQHLAAAAAGRVHKALRRQRNMERHQAELARAAGGGGAALAGGGTGDGELSLPTAVPAPTAAPPPSAGTGTRGRLLGRSPGGRVPPPPPALPSAGQAGRSGCRQEHWRVLRASRPGPACVEASGDDDAVAS